MRECVRVCMHVYDYHIAVVTKPLVLFESECVRVRVCACVRAISYTKPPAFVVSHEHERDTKRGIAALP